MKLGLEQFHRESVGSDNYLGAQYRRIAARKGGQRVYEGFRYAQEQVQSMSKGEQHSEIGHLHPFRFRQGFVQRCDK